MTSPRYIRSIINYSGASGISQNNAFYNAALDVLTYGIGTNRIGTSENLRGERILNKLSNDTGGRCFFPYSDEQLHYAFNLIEEEGRSLYSLTYVPNKKERDGKFQKIKVKLVKAKGLTVSHRKGYYAPS